MKYGTSGFRTHHSKIEEIAVQIGTAMALLTCYKRQSFGIMITASHNHHEDNGVKIMDHHGNMVSEEIEKYLENFVNNMYKDHPSQSVPFRPATLVEDYDVQLLKEHQIQLVIGYDSRESSPNIAKLIEKGILRSNLRFPVHILSHVTTPELHYIFANQDVNYTTYLQQCSDKIQYPCVVDCANGIGSKKLIEVKNDCISLINYSWTSTKLLNHECSSDFVCSNKKLPRESAKYFTSSLRASLDGDADRIVFYFLQQNNLNILNGDYIAALVLTYLSKKLENQSEKLTVGYIYTGYTNQGCVDYVKSLQFPKNIELSCICTATGVKHLHHEAEKMDIGIYFEQNGHGNVMFQKSVPEIQDLQSMFHPNIGDGILDLYATLFMLQELKMEPTDWYNLFESKFCLLTKQSVQDKDVFKSSHDELTLIEPVFIQHYIDSLCNEYVRAFVRASGTENVVRLYVEGENAEKVKQIHRKLSLFIERHMNPIKFQVKDEQFIIRNIDETDISRKYYELLGQLTQVDPKMMNREKTTEFLDSLDQHHCIFVVEQESTKEIVASGTLFIEKKLIRNYGKVGHIEDIVVHEKMRGYGLGKKMIEHVSEESKKMGCYKTILDCSDENVGFYEKCGYKRKGAQMAKYF